MTIIINNYIIETIYESQFSSHAYTHLLKGVYLFVKIYAAVRVWACVCVSVYM